MVQLARHSVKRPVKKFAWTNTLVRNIAHFQFDLSFVCVTIGKSDKNPKYTIKEWKISVPVRFEGSRGDRV